MTVILVRHAESEGNIGGVIQGWTDLPLTDIGEQQAQMVARRFKGASIAAVYSSPLYRARETARPIADVLALPLVEVDDLRERYYGQAQGLTWTEAAERWPLGVAEHHRDWAMAGVEEQADEHFPLAIAQARTEVFPRQSRVAQGFGLIQTLLQMASGQFQRGAQA